MTKHVRPRIRLPPLESCARCSRSELELIRRALIETELGRLLPLGEPKRWPQNATALARLFTERL